jgi:hypothetical protein
VSLGCEKYHVLQDGVPMVEETRKCAREKDSIGSTNIDAVVHVFGNIESSNACLPIEILWI